MWYTVVMELTLDTNLEIPSLQLGGINLEIGNINTRYKEPKHTKEVNESHLKYSEAEKLANDLHIEKGSRYFVFITGNFYFGDFIEALIVKNNYIVEELTISTLSMNYNNVDSLAILLEGNYVDKLNLIVSHYFFGHERHEHGMINYIYDNLDIDNKFQLVVCRSHTKINLLKLYNGMRIIIHGSSNLRSSGNVEQIVIEENEELFDFIYDYEKNDIKRYNLINKGVM